MRFLTVLAVCCMVALLVFGGNAAADDERFEPQTSSTRTDVPNPPVMPSTGPQNVVAVFTVSAAVGYGLHRLFGKKMGK